MVKMSRRAVPFTPFEGELKKSVVALVSNAGVHLKEGEPFDLEGDTSLRVLPGEVTGDQLMVTHAHYDHADADQDINCVFPIDRLREMAVDGIIGSIAPRFWSGFMGRIYNRTKLMQESAPLFIEKLREDAIDILVTAPA